MNKYRFGINIKFLYKKFYFFLLITVIYEHMQASSSPVQATKSNFLSRILSHSSKFTRLLYILRNLFSSSNVIESVSISFGHISRKQSAFFSHHPKQILPTAAYPSNIIPIVYQLAFLVCFLLHCRLHQLIQIYLPVLVCRYCLTLSGIFPMANSSYAVASVCPYITTNLYPYSVLCHFSLQFNIKMPAVCAFKFELSS